MARLLKPEPTRIILPNSPLVEDWRIAAFENAESHTRSPRKGPFGKIIGSMWQGLAQDMLPLKHFYRNHYFTFNDKLLGSDSAHNDLFADLATALAYYGEDAQDIPYSRERKNAIANGMELYEDDQIGIKGASGYYVTHGDGWIEEHFLQDYACMAGADVVELCFGDGHSGARLIKLFVDNNIPLPASYTINDEQDEKYLTDKAVPRMVKAGYPKDKVRFAPGDIFSKKFLEKNKNLFTAIRESKNPTVIVIRGATWNNFTFKQQAYLLQTFAAISKPGTKLLVSVDCTTNKEALGAAYQTKPFHQWIMLDFYTTCYALQQKLDVSKFESKIPLIDCDEGIRICPQIINHSRDQGFTAGNLTYVVPRLCADEIMKIKKRRIRPVFKANGWLIEKYMRYNDKNRPNYKKINHNVLVAALKAA